MWEKTESAASAISCPRTKLERDYISLSLSSSGAKNDWKNITCFSSCNVFLFLCLSILSNSDLSFLLFVPKFFDTSVDFVLAWHQQYLLARWSKGREGTSKPVCTRWLDYLFNNWAFTAMPNIIKILQTHSKLTKYCQGDIKLCLSCRTLPNLVSLHKHNLH